LYTKLTNPPVVVSDTDSDSWCGLADTDMLTARDDVTFRETSN